MAFAKLLALVTAALVSAAPAPNHSTDSTGTQASTVKAVTNRTEHSMRSLGAEFEEHWGGCRTRIGDGTGEGTHDTHRNLDKQSCKNICLNNRRCVGFEWQDGIPFLMDSKCEIHFDDLIGGAGLDLPGIKCFIRKNMPGPEHEAFYACVAQMNSRNCNPRERNCDQYINSECMHFEKGKPYTFNGYACRTGADFQERPENRSRPRTATQGECGNHCNSEPACKAYTYSAVNKECWLAFQEVRYMMETPDPRTVCVIQEP